MFRSRLGRGLPAPGRLSNSPRAMLRVIWLSTHVSNAIPGGLRSVITTMVAPLCHARGMRTTSSREVYRNPWIRVREDVLEYTITNLGPAAW